jgi:hypothetical protein
LLDLTASFSAALNLIAIFCTGRFSRPLEIEITKYGWIYKCDKIFGKKEDNFHFPIRARYAS